MEVDRRMRRLVLRIIYRESPALNSVVSSECKSFENMKSEEMILAALDAEWREVYIVEDMKPRKIRVLVKRGIEPDSLPTPEPVRSDPH